MLHSKVSYLGGVCIENRLFWDNGKLREQEQTVDDLSIQRAFNQDGLKILEIQWRKADRGRVKEVEQKFHESGALTHEQRWNKGILTSDATFYLNGQKKSLLIYSLRNGTNVCDVNAYSDKGHLIRQGVYLVKNDSPDRPIDVHRFFDNDGLLQKEQMFDERNRLSRERQFDQQGNLKSDEAVFEDGSRKIYAIIPK